MRIIALTLIGLSLAGAVYLMLLCRLLWQSHRTVSWFFIFGGFVLMALEILVGVDLMFRAVVIRWIFGRAAGRMEALVFLGLMTVKVACYCIGLTIYRRDWKRLMGRLEKVLHGDDNAC